MADLLEKAIEYFPYIFWGVMGASAVAYLAVDLLKPKSEKRIDAEFVPGWIVPTGSLPVKAIPAVITHSTYPHPQLTEGERLDYSWLRLALEREGSTVSIRNQQSVGDIVVEMMSPNEAEADIKDLVHNILSPEVVEPGHPKLAKGQRFDYAFLQEALKDGYSVLFRQAPHKTRSREIK